MSPVFRKIGALCSKDAKDLLKNPTMAVSLLLPVAFAVFFRFMMGDAVSADELAAASPEAGEALNLLLLGFTLTSDLCMCIGMIVGTTVLYGIAEEKEKHTLRTLMLANVSAGQISFSKGFVSLVATLVAACACFFVSGGVPEVFPVFLAACVLGSVPLIFVALVCGLAARDQMTAGLYSVPVVIVALLPMFGMYGEGLADIFRWMPTGGACTLVELALVGKLASTEALAAVGVSLAWVLVGAVVFRMFYRKLAQDN